jgi:hypothetical protein
MLSLKNSLLLGSDLEFKLRKIDLSTSISDSIKVRLKININLNEYKAIQFLGNTLFYCNFTKSIKISFIFVTFL